MRARINFTGRKRIGRQSVRIRMLKVPRGKPRRARVRLHLNHIEFPKEAAVTLEAYSGPISMRFSCGTIGDLQVPPELRLTELGDQEQVLFRLKVVDTFQNVGRIIGVAERITPLSHTQDGEGGRRNLLPVEPADDMDEAVWRIDMEDEYGGAPVLRINRKVLESDESVLHDTLSIGFMLPEALRQVLNELISERTPEEDDQNDWRKDWMEFCKAELGQDISGAEDEEDERAWVDRCVESFCRKYKFASNIIKQRERGDQ